MPLSEEWKALHAARWRQCLRCPLAERRISQAFEVPPAVPLVSASGPSSPLLLILYSCPDPEQGEAGTVEGFLIDGLPSSPQQRLVLGTLQALGHLIDLKESDLAYTFALGCRPASIMDSRKLMAPRKGDLRMCRPRWQSELLALDPVLVLLAGRHALEAADPTKTRVGPWLGEIVDVRVELGLEKSLLR